jgi:hypothetical protein
MLPQDCAPWCQDSIQASKARLTLQKCDAAVKANNRKPEGISGAAEAHFDFSRILETWKFPSEFLFPKRLERSEAVERLERFERAQLR